MAGKRVQQQRRLSTVTQAGKLQHALANTPQLGFRLQPVVLCADPGVFCRRLVLVLQLSMLPGTGTHDFDIQAYLAFLAEQNPHRIAGIGQAEIGQVIIDETGASGGGGG
ncbi:hypothetical protein D3C78_1476470 [compost metagenome]